jgi:long-chain fatty acid transport protein
MGILQRGLASLAVASLLGTSAFAGGFQLNEVGAKAMGQGGAFAARANDLTAMYFNPAGLAYQQGLGAYVGGTLILPSTSYTSPAGKSTDMVKQTFVPPNAYVGYGMENGLAFGIGFYSPFGLGTEWPAGWDGRYLALKVDLTDFVLNPTVAYRINEWLMVGGGMSYMWSTVKLNFNVATYAGLAPPTPAATDGLAALDANGNAVSFNLGAIVKPLPTLSIGASYRHSTKIKYEGNATFTNMQGLATFFPGGTGTTTINFPNQLFAGISYDVCQDLTVEADYQWIRWSTYDTLTIVLPNGPNTPAPLGGGPLQTTLKKPEEWTNAFMLRVGAEYRKDQLAYRLGFIYDATPQPNKRVEPLLPDANRFEGTIGLGYKVDDNWSVDVAYQLIIFKNRTVTGPTTGDMNAFPGTYKETANLFGLSIAYAM